MCKVPLAAVADILGRVGKRREEHALDDLRDALGHASAAAGTATAPTATTAVEASLAMRRRYRLQFAREVWRWQVRLLQRMDRAIVRDAGSAAGRAGRGIWLGS
jgi:hypothetical protein